MKQNIITIIDEKYSEFSKNHKVLADYIKQNINIIAFLSIKELSEKSKISMATITRFTKEIGFDGYVSFQKYLSEMMKNNITPMKEIKEIINEKEEKNILKNIIDSNANVLHNMYTENLNENFKKAIDILGNTEGKIYITASRSSYSVAYYLYFMLKGIREDIYLLTNENSDISLKLMYLEEKDKLIAISYARYSRFTYEMTKFFKEKKCRIISITDDINSPIALNSENVLLAKNSDISYSFVGAMTLANSIAVSLGRIDREKVLERMKLQDKIAIENGIYL